MKLGALYSGQIIESRLDASDSARGIEANRAAG
jgi:hypothetical protein